MFCTISLIESKKRFSKNLIINENKIGELTYYSVVIRKKSLLKKVEKKLKNKVDTVIVSDNIDFNEIDFKKLSIYDSSNYFKEIVKSTFKKIIGFSNIPINKLSICVIDYYCEYPEFIYDLADKCSIIKIVTKNFEKYLPFADEIYDDFGMKPIVTSIVDSADLGIDLSSKESRIWFNNYENHAFITKECVKIGIGFNKLVPKGINQCDFASVLQNYKEFNRIKFANTDTIIKSNKLYKINENNIQNFLDNGVKT